MKTAMEITDLILKWQKDTSQNDWKNNFYYLCSIFRVKTRKDCLFSEVEILIGDFTYLRRNN